MIAKKNCILQFNEIHLWWMKYATAYEILLTQCEKRIAKLTRVIAMSGSEEAIRNTQK